MPVPDDGRAAAANTRDIEGPERNCAVALVSTFFFSLAFSNHIMFV